jgi:DNA-binding transcriptional LysR family regulator
MPLDLDTNLLRTLTAIADTSNFSRAAAQLGITQSAVTLRIQKLEHLVKRALVHRSRTGVALTEDGRVLVQYARKILELNDEAIEHIATKNSRESISMGVIEEFERFYLEEFLADFHRRHPRVRIDVVVDYSRNLKKLMDEDKIRLAIMKSAVAEGQATPLYSDRLVWVASQSVTIAPKIREIPLVVSPEPCINRAVMMKALDDARLPWRVVSSCPTLSGVVAAVKAGLGVSAIDLLSIQPSMRILTTLDGLPPLPDSHIGILRRPGRSDRLLDWVIDEVKGFVGRKDACARPSHLQSASKHLEREMAGAPAI